MGRTSLSAITALHSQTDLFLELYYIQFR